MDVIPLIRYPNQELQIILDDQDCTIRVTERSRYTFLDLTVGDTPVRKGMICTPYARVLSEPCAFRGNFFVFDNQTKPQEQTPPEWEGWNARWWLVYFTAAEMAEFEQYRYQLAEQSDMDVYAAIGYGVGAYGIMRYGQY